MVWTFSIGENLVLCSDVLRRQVYAQGIRHNHSFTNLTFPKRLDDPEDAEVILSWRSMWADKELGSYVGPGSRNDDRVGPDKKQ